MRVLTFLIPYNTTTTLRMSLTDAGTGNFKASPTLAAGDVKCSQAGGAEANLGTLPSVNGSNNRQVDVTIADTECDNVGGVIRFSDQTTPKDWDDLELHYFTYGHASAMYENFNDAALDAAGIRSAVGLASANLDTQFDALPTNAELATALAAADDAVLAAVAALNNLSIADIRAAVGLAAANLDTQLADLPTNAELATALAAADDAVLAAIAALNNLSQANIRTAVGLASANLDTQLAKLDTIDDFLDTEVAAIKAKTDNLPAAPAAVGDIPTVGQIADAVWDEDVDASHQTAGSAGKKLDDAGAAGVPPTASAIADQVWDELLSGHTGAGSAGKTLADILVDTAGIGAAEITVTSPVADGGDVAMIAGYDYTDESERALEWESDSWPDLTGATVDVVKPELDEEDPPEEISFGWTVTVEDEGEPTQRVKAEVTGVQTADLGTPGRTAKHRFRIKATLANDAQVALVDATMTIT